MRFIPFTLPLDGQERNYTIIQDMRIALGHQPGDVCLTTTLEREVVLSKTNFPLRHGTLLVWVEHGGADVLHSFTCKLVRGGNDLSSYLREPSICIDHHPGDTHAWHLNSVPLDVFTPDRPLFSFAIKNTPPPHLDPPLTSPLCSTSPIVLKIPFIVPRHGLFPYQLVWSCIAGVCHPQSMGTPQDWEQLVAPSGCQYKNNTLLISLRNTDVSVS